MYFPQFRRHADQVIVGCRHRQPVRTVSMPLSIERSRSDENCSFCLIRQFGSSLYFVIVPCCSNNCAAGDFYRATRHVSGCHAAPTDLCLDASVVAPYARWALECRCVVRCGRRRFVASRLTPRCASPNAADNQPFLTAVCHTAQLNRLAVSCGGRPPAARKGMLLSAVDVRRRA